MKRPILERAADFILGRGFYIVLALCVAAMGASGYYLMRTASRTAAPVQPAGGTPTIVLPDPPPKPAPRPLPANPAPARPAPPPAPTDEQPVPPAPEVYTWPVKGTVVRGFDVEQLNYDETMGDWRVHDGADISCPKGTSVSPIRGGTVQEVFPDDLMGTTVVVDHGDGAVSSYSCLAPRPPVKAGDRVEPGQTLGMVGDSPLGESALPVHLHLSMTVDGLSVDPMDYLPER